MFYRNDKYIYFALMSILAVTLRCFLHIALQQNGIWSPLSFYKYSTISFRKIKFQYFQAGLKIFFFTLLMYRKPGLLVLTLFLR